MPADRTARDAASEVVAEDEPRAELVPNPTGHDAAGRLGWTSMRCGNGYDGCDDTGCCCTCHDKRDREAVRAAFRRGLTDGR